MCSETCVGRIRYLGVLLYDADAIENAASTENEKDLYQRQLDVFLDPNDPKVIEQALKDGVPQGVIEAAQQSPVYKMAMDWKLALLSLCALPLGLVSMMAMYRAGTSKMGAYYASAQKMNNTIIEYINGMEVVKVFNRDGESYQRFEQDVRGYRDFTLAWYKVCWPWMASTTASCPAWPCSPCPSGRTWSCGGIPPCRISPWCCACPSAWVRRCCGRWVSCPPCPRSTTRSPPWSS